MHAASAGLFHSLLANHSHLKKWPIKEISKWYSSINHGNDRMLWFRGLALFLHQSWAPSDSVIDEVKGVLISAPPSPFHSQIPSLGWARDGIWAMVVFTDDE